MRIEVLIPCYKSAATIERAIDSAASQSRPPDRIILHDDASPDGSQALLGGLVQKRSNASLLKSDTNVGILRSRKRLVEESEGDVVCFLDHDDAWPSDYLSCIERTFSDPDIAAVVAPANNIDTQGTVISRVLPRHNRLRRADLEFGIREIFLHYLVATWSCLSLRREVAASISELEGFHSGEEFALIALSLEKGDIEFIGEPAVSRHLSQFGASSNAYKQQLTELELLRWFSKRYDHLTDDVPEKVSAIFGNSVYRYLLSGDRVAARRTMGALLRGALHPKVLYGCVALLLGPSIVGRIRPTR
jgi:glycosyltransferase involved in cell wall biosynthesis